MGEKLDRNGNGIKVLPLSLVMWIIGGICSVFITAVVGIASYYKGQLDIVEKLRAEIRTTITSTMDDHLRTQEKEFDHIDAQLHDFEQRIRKLELERVDGKR